MKDAFLTTARRHNTIVIERGVVFREREREEGIVLQKGGEKPEASFIGSRKERKGYHSMPTTTKRMMRLYP